MVIVTRSALAQEYSIINGAPPFAATEQMFTIDPRTLFSIMCFAAPYVIKNGSLTLIANFVSKDLAAVGMSFPLNVTAAALTIPEIGPISFIASTTLGITASASDALKDQREWILGRSYL